jgi:hypothetical protein
VTFRQLFLYGAAPRCFRAPRRFEHLGERYGSLYNQLVKTFLKRKMGQVFGGMFENPVVPGLERSGSLKPANGKTARMILSKTLQLV